MKEQSPSAVAAALLLASALQAETSSSVSFRFDIDDRTAMPPAGQFSFDPVVQGWSTFELTSTSGEDLDGDGRVDEGNHGPIYDAQNNAIAWQIFDRETSGAVNIPTYRQTLTSDDYQVLFDEGWTYEFTVRTGATRGIIASTAGERIRAGFTGWTVQLADDPGWGLDARGVDVARVGFWVGNDSTQLEDGTRDQRFWIEDASGTRTVLAPGSANEFQTIRCVNAPGEPTYEWFLNGESMGILDFRDSPLDSGALVQFTAGQSTPRGGAVDWKKVELASCPPPVVPIVEQTVITEVKNMGDELMIEFQSNFPAGTDFQPQYADGLDVNFVDIPDATVTFLESVDGIQFFEVMAPRFGTERGFYRVISSAAANPAAPIGDTLNSPPPERGDQLMTLSFTPADGDNAATIESELQIYFDDGPEPGFQDRLQADLTDGMETGATTSSSIDFVTADLDGSGQPRPIFCWPDENGNLQLVIRSVPQSGTDWPDEMIVHAIPNATVIDGGVIRIVTANLDDDEEPELFVAWQGENDRISLVPVDFDGNHRSTPRIGAIDSSTVFLRNADAPDLRAEIFDLTSGNFTGLPGSPDEAALSLTLADPENANRFRIGARFFTTNFTETRLLTELDGGEVTVTSLAFSSPGEGFQSVNVFSEKIDPECDGKDELLVANTERRPGGLDVRTDLHAIRPGRDGESNVVGPRFQNASSPAIGNGLALATVNLDEDKAKEVFLGATTSEFLKLAPDLSFTSIGRTSSFRQPSFRNRRSLALMELEVEPPSGALPGVPYFVVMGERFVNRAFRPFIETYALVNDGGSINAVSISEKQITQSNPDRRGSHFLISAAFSPLDIKLGVPRRYTRIVPNRPTVVLNAPPVHFDVINGVEYDVNDTFPTADCPPQGCPFVATYTRTASETVTVETQWKRSWAVSTEVSGGFNIGPVGVEAAVNTSYGQDFDDFTANAETTTVTTEIEAVDDDRIYATTLSYDIWEYPVILDGEIISRIIVTDPSVTRDRWFGSKTVVAQNYRPRHEVGNILSYPNTIPDENDDFVREVVSGDSFTISSAAGDQSWFLTRTTGSTTRASRTNNFSVSASASLDIPVPFIPNVKITGDYNSSSLASSETIVEDSEGLSVVLGSTNGSIAGTDYAITPYLFWDPSGAVVLDYAVEPFGGTPSSPTFWSQNYGEKPDLTFVLPRRLDPEKGLALINEKLRRRTSDILTLPLEPRLGEQVEVIAELSNFAFPPNEEAFAVRFYFGDPDEGGEQIHVALVPAEALPGRGKFRISFPWTVPDDLNDAISFEIHAVIDTGNTIDEIHENNNSGWNEVFVRLAP